MMPGEERTARQEVGGEHKCTSEVASVVRARRLTRSARGEMLASFVDDEKEEDEEDERTDDKEEGA